MSKAQNAKDVVLPHSQAKLDLYRNYLLHYLKILSLSPYCSKMNLFDIYCGIGVYKDGNIGSPIITNNSIKEINSVLKKMSKSVKPISIYINDFKADKINKVKELLEKDKVENCEYEYFNIGADEMLDEAARKVNSFHTSERSLIFIDPYGYSQIHRQKIYDLLKNAHTEILMFLPVMQMYRFADIAINDPDRACYDDLRKFIFSFFPSTHKIHTDSIENIFEFIHEIKLALSFEHKFYTCSHYIERGKGNYYALFFITSNIYGLDKMVEAKWKLDPIRGKGYSQKRNSAQTLMFQDYFEAQDTMTHLDFLSKLIIKELSSRNQINNVDLYELALVHEFRPMHCKKVLTELVESKTINAYDIAGEKLSHLEGAYIDYGHFKKDLVMIIYKLNQHGTIKY